MSIEKLDAAFTSAAAEIEHDVVLAELTDDERHSLIRAVLLAMRDDAGTEVLTKGLARRIAQDAFGRPWDDFERLNAFDTDQCDLKQYARAASAAMIDHYLKDQNND